MLLDSVFTKAVRDNTLTVLALVAILVGFAVLMSGLFSIIGDDYIELVRDLPPAMQAIYGSTAATSTVAGLMASAIFSLLVPIIVLAYGIVQGTRSAVGEEESRSLVLLLAYPVTRRGVLLSKAAALAIGLIAIMVFTWLSLELSFVVFDLGDEGLSIVSATLQLGGLVLMFSALALALAAWLGSSLVAIGITAIVALVSYLATTMLPLVEGLEDVARISPWWLYAGAEALTDGIDVPLLAIALVMALGLTALSVVGLERRDLKG